MSAKLVPLLSTDDIFRYSAADKKRPLPVSFSDPKQFREWIAQY
jgi:hypothetical protein